LNNQSKLQFFGDLISLVFDALVGFDFDVTTLTIAGTFVREPIKYHNEVPQLTFHVPSVGWVQDFNSYSPKVFTQLQDLFWGPSRCQKKFLKYGMSSARQSELIEVQMSFTHC
jgi:hypothetical protein